MIDLDLLEKLDKAATKEPWEVWTHAGGFHGIRELLEPPESQLDIIEDPSLEDIRLLVELRNAAPALITELRAARRVVEAARKFHGNINESVFTQNCTVCQEIAAYDTATRAGAGGYRDLEAR